MLTEPDVFNENCPCRQLLKLLAEKWVLLIVHALAGGPLRTAALRRAVGGISEKMLFQTLRRLERSGLVERRAYAEVPPRVDYRLTDLGRSLSVPVRAMDAWIEQNLKAVQKAEQAYDSAQAGEAKPAGRESAA